MADLSGWWDDYFWGAMTVLKVFGVSVIMAVIFGLIGASAKLSKNRIANKIAGAYTIVFRGTPELLVLLLFYYGSAIALTGIMQIFFPRNVVCRYPSFLGRFLCHCFDCRLLRDRDLPGGLSGR